MAVVGKCEDSGHPGIRELGRRGRSERVRRVVQFAILEGAVRKTPLLPKGLGDTQLSEGVQRAVAPGVHIDQDIKTPFPKARKVAPTAGVLAQSTNSEVTSTLFP